MESIEEYIERISKLANRNTGLNNQLHGLVSRYELIQRQNEKYQNLLSEFSYEEMEDGARVPPKRRMKRFKMVSILYATMRGFRKLSQRTDDAQELIDQLDELYIAFDRIAKKYGVVKVKTIGDAFLYAGGIASVNRTNPIDVVRVALEMQKAVAELHTVSSDEAFWEISIGIHTGPVIGEPTGKKAVPFTLTGESVNVASRLGRACPPNKISLSVMTYELVKEFFEMNGHGFMPVKYKGPIELYNVSGILSHLAKDEENKVPNDAFRVKYSLIQFMDIQEELLDILERKLPENLYYHNVKHTIDVVTEVELIGWAEGLSEEEILQLKLAALFHDSGHTIDYASHEECGAQIARDILNSYDYPQRIVDTVCRLIMSTKFPPSPKDKLEQVICDSDLDYLGRSDFIPVSNTLYDELKERNMIGSLEDWNRKQIAFISSHQYYTETARKLREVAKQNQIDRLQRLIEAESQERTN